MRYKIHLTIIAACAVGILFAYYLYQAKEQTTSRLTLLNEITELERRQQELAREILHSGFFLYHDYDRIHRLLREMEHSLASATALHRGVGRERSPVPRLLESFSLDLQGKEEQIVRFLTLNSMLKNSAMYIPQLSRRIMATTPGGLDFRYQTILTDLTSALYLARNSLDPDLLMGLAATLEELAGVRPPAAAAELHQALLTHGRIFTQVLPEYERLLAAGLDPAGSRLLRQLLEAMKAENSSWLNRLNLLTHIFFAAFMASVVLIILLLIKAARENLALNQLSAALTVAATSDRLTQLANRFSFDSDQESRRRPLLLLINIDDFKHINDIYGVQAGDYVLAGLAAALERLQPPAIWSRCYRLGGDDFGMLLEEPVDFNPEELAGKILTAMDAEQFVYREQPIRITVSIGISRRRPLLETADMALKECKRLKRSRFLLYRDELNLQERIATNLRVLQNVRRALAADDILVYYQPIFDNLSGEIAKYEALVRLRDEDGAILSPGYFLDLVKESPLYPEITKRVVSQSFADLADSPYGFSINLAVTDILDTEVRDYILTMIATHPETARRLTFEILENEGMENMEEVRSFIEQVKEAGCQIAVDDFGSGYSNFAHILKLQVDSLKIDASLIRNIDHDTQARVMVHTIVDFCRKLGINTVAEFVHSAPVHAMVKQLGIDYSQGFHLGEPAPKCHS